MGEKRGGKQTLTEEQVETKDGPHGLVGNVRQPAAVWRELVNSPCRDWGAVVALEPPAFPRDAGSASRAV
jgi:hypothetical protein